MRIELRKPKFLKKRKQEDEDARLNECLATEDGVEMPDATLNECLATEDGVEMPDARLNECLATEDGVEMPDARMNECLVTEDGVEMPMEDWWLRRVALHKEYEEQLETSPEAQLDSDGSKISKPPPLSFLQRLQEDGPWDILCNNLEASMLGTACMDAVECTGEKFVMTDEMERFVIWIDARENIGIAIKAHKETGGVYVCHVDPRSKAASIGLGVGMKIVAINGELCPDNTRDVYKKLKAETLLEVVTEKHNPQSEMFLRSNQGKDTSFETDPTVDDDSDFYDDDDDDSSDDEDTVKTDAEQQQQPPIASFEVTRLEI